MLGTKRSFQPQPLCDNPDALRFGTLLLSLQQPPVTLTDGDEDMTSLVNITAIYLDIRVGSLNAHKLKLHIMGDVHMRQQRGRARQTPTKHRCVSQRCPGFF